MPLSCPTALLTTLPTILPTLRYQTPRMWGHAVSDDLVNWQQLPMAATRQQPYDEGGDL